MKYRILKPTELTPALRQAWRGLCAAGAGDCGAGHDSEAQHFRVASETSGVWRSPFFQPEFAQAVGQVRDDVEVLAGEDDAGLALVFPFQRLGWGALAPLAGRLSDFHGVLARPGLAWRMEELLEACRAAALEFDHWADVAGPLAPYIVRPEASRFLDLSRGYSAYEAQRLTAAAADVRDVLRRQRKLVREATQVEYLWNDADPTTWAQLLAWKSAQYARSGFTDVLAFSWVRRLLEAVRDSAAPELSGVLSSLRVDGRLAAVHFGMRSGNVLHSWFPAYDRELSRLGPGLLLLLAIVQQAPERGVTRIDLGKGDERYKLTLASSADLVGAGVIDLRPLASSVRGAWRATRDWARATPFRKQFDAPVAWLRRMREWMTMR